MIRKGIKYKRRYDLEDEKLCTIWTEVNLNKGKSVLIMGGYRQWNLIKYFNNSKSGDINNQLNRFRLIINNWKKALAVKIKMR